MSDYIMATVALARMQQRREKWTKDGLSSSRRKVVEGFDIEQFVDPHKDEHDMADRDKQFEIIKKHIRECTRNPNMRMLIEWHLFEGEAVVELAELFGVKESAARSAVIRAKRYLGIIGEKRRFQKSKKNASC